MQAKIAILPGDGIGPEVTMEAINVLRQVAECFGHSFHFEEHPIGRAALKAHGNPLPDSTVQVCRKADAVLLGALDIGQSKDEAMFHAEAERGLMAVKRALGMMVSLRPVKPHPALRLASPLREQILEDVDLLLVRCLCNNVPGDCDEDMLTVVVDAACHMARTRRNHVTSVDRVMTSQNAGLWRTVPPRVAANYPDVQLEQMPVDICLRQMLFDPRNLDVIVSDNILGAALTNQSVALVGSPALLPVGGRGMGTLGVYAPACGPMFDQAGLDSANPIGAILAAAMMLHHSFSLEREAEAIERAIDSALGSGARTADIAGEGERIIGTHAMGEAIAAWVCSFAGQPQRSLRAEAYVIVDIQVTDPVRYEEYKKLAPPSLAAYGGRYVARGGKTETLEGDWSPQRLVILEFENAERARAWLNSPEYRAARQLRHQTAKANMIVVEGV
jgi:3-isopropylmalate dehydrogenase